MNNIFNYNNYDCVTTKFGNIYFEKVEKQEEYDRLKMYDSNGKYLDYYCLDFREDDLEELPYYKEQLAEAKTIEELKLNIGYDNYTASLYWCDLLEDLYNDYYFDNSNGTYCDVCENGGIRTITEQRIMQNEWVNKIGD